MRLPVASIPDKPQACLAGAAQVLSLRGLTGVFFGGVGGLVWALGGGRMLGGGRLLGGGRGLERGGGCRIWVAVAASTAVSAWTSERIGGQRLWLSRCSLGLEAARPHCKAANAALIKTALQSLLAVLG